MHLHASLRPHPIHNGRIDALRPRADAQPAAQRPLAQRKDPHELRSCDVFDWHDRLVPYEQAWALQKELVARVAADHDARGAGSADAALLLQHPPTITLGTGSSEGHLRFDPCDPPFPLYRTERGGEATYHGPGQLVLYPLLCLRHHTQDLHWYMRSLEEVVIRALYEVSGLRGERIPGLTGVWVGGAKVAAAGVRCTRWVTYHGIALNVCPDLLHFGHIVPCGIADRPVGSVASALGLTHLRAPAPDPMSDSWVSAGGAAGSAGGTVASRDGGNGTAVSAGVRGASDAGGACGPEHSGPRGAAHSVADVGAGMGVHWGGEGDADALLREYRYALLDAFADVFGLSLSVVGGAA